jgi:type I site-specific restriction endonuclease
MNKKELTERDICTKHIVPTIEAAGWDIHTQFQKECLCMMQYRYMRFKILLSLWNLV